MVSRFLAFLFLGGFVFVMVGVILVPEEVGDGWVGFLVAEVICFHFCEPRCDHLRFFVGQPGGYSSTVSLIAATLPTIPEYHVDPRLIRRPRILRRFAGLQEK